MKQLTHPVLNIPVKLGKTAPRLDNRTLKLAKYIKAVTPPPAQASFMQKIKSWPMYLNDVEGCCVISCGGHEIQQVTAYASTEKRITDGDIQKGYMDVGGYVPGDPSTDNGCDMLTALKYRRKIGLGGHKIRAFAALDTSKPNEFKQTIALFGSVEIGVALPISAQAQVGPDSSSQNVWAVPSFGLQGDGSPGTWGGHCIPGCEYSKSIMRVVTWGGVQMMTWNFLAAYCDEAYAVLTDEWIEANGKSPSGFDVKTLLADLSSVTG